MFKSLKLSRIEYVVLYHYVIHVGIVGSAFGIVHGHVEEFLSRLLQSRCGGVVLYAIIFQIVEPFLNRGSCYLVELVHADDVILREHILRSSHSYLICFFRIHFQVVAGVNAGEHGLAVVEIVVALAKIEIDDVDGINLFHLIILVAYLDMFGDSLRHTVEHTLEIVQLSRELHLDDNNFTFRVFRLDVNTVELRIFSILISLTFKQFGYFNLLTEKHRHQSFQHCEVCLVAQHSLHCPVKSYVLVLYLHSCFSVVSSAKVGIKNDTTKLFTSFSHKKKCMTDA